MKKLHLITLPRLNRSVARVIGELERHGFWDDKLDAIDVFLVPVGTAYGWQWSVGSGCIDIPAVSLCRLRDFFVGEYQSLIGVLRHEYGHAVAHTHKALVRSRSFRVAFGASHDSHEADYADPDQYVSPYAAMNPSEDFAEVFACFLKHKGMLPPKFNTPVIRKKWLFVKALGRAIDQGRTRW